MSRRNIVISAGLLVSLVLIVVAIKKHLPSKIDHKESTSRYIRDNHKDRVIVFVHGLNGDSTDTWTCTHSSSWQDLMVRDHAFDDSDIYVAGYDSGIDEDGMDVDEVVASLKNKFDSDKVITSHRDVVFVAHSLGGIIVQRYLLTHRDVAQKTQPIYFFSTPETGSQLAKLTNLFSKSMVINELSSGNANDYLQNIEQEWIHAQFSSIKRYCAYEKLPIHGIIVVDRLSSTRNCINELPIAKDHMSIVKPCNEKDDAYIALRNAILENPIPIVDKSRVISPAPLPQLANLRFEKLKPAYLQSFNNQGLTEYWIPPNEKFEVNAPYKAYGPGDASHVHFASKVLMISKVDQSTILAEGKKLDASLASKTEGSSMAPNDSMYSTPVGNMLSDEDISNMRNEKTSLIVLLALHYDDAGGSHHVHKCWIVYPSPLDARRAEPIFGSCGAFTDFR
jgi:hypothetical protein